MNQSSEKKYCKNCRRYLGDIRTPYDYPTNRGGKWEYTCGIDNKDVYDRNRNNDCKDYVEKTKAKIKKAIKNKWRQLWN